MRFVAAASVVLAILNILLPSELSAQQVYVPRAVKESYKQGTRRPDGRPGPKYWQNRARYSITLAMTPPDRNAKGSEHITYFNDSPDTLNSLVVKLFLNVHKPGAPRSGGASEASLNSGMRIDAFAVNGRPATWTDDSGTFTWKRVRLPSALLPHDSVGLTLDWHFEISKEQGGREGLIDSTTFFLAYFYPRVAVYDDYNGWDTMDFTGQQEFYNDFNDYDVTVSVPANYVVWGTGTLVNASEVLHPGALQRFQASMTSDKTIRVAGIDELAAKTVTQQRMMNGWHFKANAIPDMAFGISDHYDWDAASVIVDDATGRRASVQAAYNDTAADFHRMVAFGRHALDWLSHSWPATPYPYEKTTIFQGFAGMEYPMMANDETYADTVFSRIVAEHELAHTYFPFYTGLNETRYPFMDEGLATTFEYLVEQTDLGKEKGDALFKQFRINDWMQDRSPIEEVPIITPADMLKQDAYTNNAYGKPALGYLAVKDMVGDSAFRNGLRAFIDRWHGKHPTPWDLFNTFNAATGENLDWFWNNWFFSNHHIDLAVSEMKKSRQGYSVGIMNVGGMAAPVDIVVTYADGTSQALHQTSAIWKTNQRQATVLISTKKSIQSIVLDGGIWMDADTSNNRWPKKR